MSGITKTVPQKKGEQAVNQLYDGSMTEFEFHMRGKPGKLDVGDYVYTIWQNELVGRCQVTRIVLNVRNPETDKVQTLIYVSCPGERLGTPIPYDGHRGTRYYKGPDWDSLKG